MDKLYDEVKKIARTTENMQELMGHGVAASYLSEQLEKIVVLIEQNNSSQRDILIELMTIRRLLESK